MRFKTFRCTRLGDIRALVNWAAERYSDNVAYREIGRDKQLLDYTYDRLKSDMDALGTKLMDIGLCGSHIALIGESMVAWVLCYVTVTGGLGVVVPIDRELPAKDIAALLRKSDTDAVICSETYAPIVASILPECPRIRMCAVMNPTQEHPGFLSLPELVRSGAELLEAGDRRYADLQIDAEAMCEILFTSGTTGANKGVMLSSRNIMSVVYGMMQLIHTTPVSISVLPINHSYECTCHVLGGMYSGLTLCFNDSLKHLMDNLLLFKPGMSLMVPLFLETMYKRIWKEAEKNGLATHLRYAVWFSNIIRQIGIDGRKLFFKPILDRFGGNLTQIVCGGAPLRTELIRGFDSLGINVVNGYGITECAPVISTNCTAWKRLNSVGRVLDVCQVRIDQPDRNGCGEVQVKGDIVMLGYYKDEESTAASFTPDGYFKTGDLGRLDRDNFLYLTGRMKNLIILSNGKNICPEELEEEILRQIPYVREVLVYAHAANPFVEESICADIYPDPEYVEGKAPAAIKATLDADMKKLNARLASYKRIQLVNIREREFEKTTTKKIKRHAVLEGRVKLA